MIVYNILAIPVVLLVGAIGAGLVWLLPAQCGGPYEEITYSVVAIVVGGLGEAVGLRARLFFLPVWLVGTGVLAWSLYGLYGMLGFAIGGAVLVLALSAFAAIVVVSMGAAAKEIPQRIGEARAAIAAGDAPKAREALADAWVLPMGALTSERARQLLEVLSIVEGAERLLALPAAGAALVRASRPILERAAGGAKVGFISDDAQILGELDPMLRTPEDWKLKDEVAAILAKMGGAT